MILPFEQYNPQWGEQFTAIKQELEQLLESLPVRVDHIGSTSVAGLAAKPVIDILVGLENETDLDQVPLLLAGNNYVYYEKYNNDMPYRRFFVLLQQSPGAPDMPAHIRPGDAIPEKLHDHRWRKAHIHVIPERSEHWLRHIAFRDYLRSHPVIKAQYQALKEQLIKREWLDGNDYNAGKDLFLKEQERLAVAWYQTQKR